MLVRHRAPTWGIGLLALALGGCGGSEEAAPSADATTAEAYPALAASFGFDQADLNRILLDGAGRAIEEQSIKSFVIGTGIRRDAGLYLNRPILDIRALADESYLDTDLTTQSSDQASVRISSGKEGSSESSQWKLSVSSSLSFGGFGVQATGSGERKFTETKNSGAATIRFDKVTSGGKVRLITGNFANSADFSSYLIGTPLTGEQLRQYVDYSECRVGIFNSQRYVCELRITNGGVISPGGENVYGSVQVLNELQRIFSLSKAQYAEIADGEIRGRLTATMRTLRQIVRERIDDFYLNNGQAFVSEVTVMNEARAVGTLAFSAKNGAEEMRWGAALSVGYQGLLGGSSGSSETTGLKANGWSNAFKDIKVEAVSNPATLGSDKMLEWATRITEMLNNEAAPLSVPTLTGLPTQPDVTLPELAKKKPPLAAPPNTLFNYEDWKKYKEDMTPEGQRQRDQAKIDAEVEARLRLLDRPERPPAPPAPPDNGNGGVQAGVKSLALGGTVSYAEVAAELERLQALRGTGAPLRVGATPNNIMRIDNQFVSGFRTTDYDRVIPQLRPDLRIPGEPVPSPSYYVTITNLRMTVDRIDDASAYLAFLSNVPASRVTAKMADDFATVNRTFRTSAFRLIQAASINGVDVDWRVFRSLLADMFGAADGSNLTQSLLYTTLGDRSAYDYIRFTILAPASMAVWAEAPAGFIPFAFRQQGDENTVAYHDVSGIGYVNGKPYLKAAHDYAYGSAAENVLDFYTRKLPGEVPAVAPQTPWFPVFQFSGASTPSLVFVQFAGPNQIVYGRQYVVMPVDPSPNNTKTSPDFRLANPVNAAAKLSEAMLRRIGESRNSFARRCTDSDPSTIGDERFSIHFPKRAQESARIPDPLRAANYRMLMLRTGPDCTPEVLDAPADGGYQAVDWITGYRGFNVEFFSGSARLPYVSDSRDEAVSVFRLFGNQTGRAVIMLLPILPRNAGDASFQRLYRWTSTGSLRALVRDDDYRDFDTARVLR